MCSVHFESNQPRVVTACIAAKTAFLIQFEASCEIHSLKSIFTHTSISIVVKAYVIIKSAFLSQYEVCSEYRSLYSGFTEISTSRVIHACIIRFSVNSSH